MNGNKRAHLWQSISTSENRKASLELNLIGVGRMMASEEQGIEKIPVTQSGSHHDVVVSAARPCLALAQ
jgi:hypothetical protein